MKNYAFLIKSRINFEMNLIHFCNIVMLYTLFSVLTIDFVAVSLSLKSTTNEKQGIIAGVLLGSFSSPSKTKFGMNRISSVKEVKKGSMYSTGLVLLNSNIDRVKLTLNELFLFRKKTLDKSTLQKEPHGISIVLT